MNLEYVYTYATLLSTVQKLYSYSGGSICGYGKTIMLPKWLGLPLDPPHSLRARLEHLISSGQ